VGTRRASGKEGEMGRADFVLLEVILASLGFF